MKVRIACGHGDGGKWSLTLSLGYAGLVEPGRVILRPAIYRDGTLWRISSAKGEHVQRKGFAVELHANPTEDERWDSMVIQSEALRGVQPPRTTEGAVLVVVVLSEGRRPSVHYRYVDLAKGRHAPWWSHPWLSLRANLVQWKTIEERGVGRAF